MKNLHRLDAVANVASIQIGGDVTDVRTLSYVGHCPYERDWMRIVDAHGLWAL